MIAMYSLNRLPIRFDRNVMLKWWRCHIKRPMCIFLCRMLKLTINIHHKSPIQSDVTHQVRMHDIWLTCSLVTVSMAIMHDLVCTPPNPGLFFPPTPFSSFLCSLSVCLYFTSRSPFWLADGWADESLYFAHGQTATRSSDAAHADATSAPDTPPTSTLQSNMGPIKMASIRQRKRLEICLYISYDSPAHNFRTIMSHATLASIAVSCQRVWWLRWLAGTANVTISSLAFANPRSFKHDSPFDIELLRLLSITQKGSKTRLDSANRL